MNEQKNTNDGLAKVIENLTRQGITDEDEQLEIIFRDHVDLLPQPTKNEILIAATEDLILEANRESMQSGGHPAIVCVRIDGEMRYRSYSAFTESEIKILKEQ